MTDGKDSPGAGSSTGLEALGGVAGAGVGLAIAGPIGALLGGAASPMVTKALELVRTKYAERQEARIVSVIALAARLADVDVERLMDRLQHEPDREDLLIRTLRAAQESAVLEKVVSLAVSLQRQHGTRSEDLPFESFFVSTISDVSKEHIQALRLFVRTSNQLGLGDGSPDFDVAPDGLNRVQLVRASPTLAVNADPILAALERHGLASSTIQAGGMVYALGPENVHWRITDYGRQFLERMDAVDELIATGVR